MTLGATPLGANNENNEEDASRNIRRMFGEVAPRYDLLNRLLSLYIDQFWRRTLVRQTRTELKKTHTRILDLCCGTGDLLCWTTTDVLCCNARDLLCCHARDLLR